MKRLYSPGLARGYATNFARSRWGKRLPRLKPGLNIAFIVSVAIASIGCKSRPGTAEPPGPPRAYAEIAQRHNDRLQQLQTTYSNGVIEFRWTDAKGRHFEQGNMELWLSLPRRTALRVEKLGEVFLWLGSDDSRWWLFDMLGREKTLYVGSHEDEPLLDDAGAVPVKPLALLDLMAMTPLPMDSSQPPPVQFDSQRKGWMVQAPGAGGMRRIYFDPQTMLPTATELLSDRGEPIMSSTLRRYESVRQANMPVPAFPKMAELIDLDVFAGDQPASVKIAINETTGIVEPATLQRVFDFERLRRGMRVDRVVEARSPQSP